MEYTRKTSQCHCCKGVFTLTGMLGGVKDCGCETALCSICHNCVYHCSCEWGRKAQIEKIRTFAEQQKAEQEKEKMRGIKLKFPMRYDRHRNAIRDAMGNIVAVLSSAIGDERLNAERNTERGEQIVAVLNATATPEGCTPSLDLLAQRNALTETNIQLEEQLAEAKGKVGRFEAMLGAIKRLRAHWETPQGEWPVETWDKIHDDLCDALTAFEAIQEGRDGDD